MRMTKKALPVIKRQIKWGTLLCCMAVIAAAGLNILFTSLRTEANHAFMLLANILADTLAGWFVIFFGVSYVAPRKWFYAIACKPSQRISGIVGSVSEHTTRQMKLDCRELTVGGRKLFLPAHFPAVEVGAEASFDVVSNVIVEVEYA